MHVCESIKVILNYGMKIICESSPTEVRREAAADKDSGAIAGLGLCRLAANCWGHRFCVKLSCNGRLDDIREV